MGVLLSVGEVVSKVCIQKIVYKSLYSKDCI